MSGSDDYTSEDAACDREAERERRQSASQSKRQRKAMENAGPLIQQRAAVLLAGICDVYHACNGRPMLKINGWLVGNDEWDVQEECLAILKEIGVE
jgi:hypothetical protein